MARYTVLSAFVNNNEKRLVENTLFFIFQLTDIKQNQKMAVAWVKKKILCIG